MTKAGKFLQEADFDAEDMDLLKQRGQPEPSWMKKMRADKLRDEQELNIHRKKGNWTKDSWGDVPPPFNPDFDPKAKARYAAVTTSMEEDEYYRFHTREECKQEWARRYDELKERGK